MQIQKVQNTVISNDSPESWGVGFQDSASELMYFMQDLHDSIIFSLIIQGTVVAWFQVTSLVNSFVKGIPYTKFRHGELLELIWTCIPAQAIWAIGVPSFNQQYISDEVVQPELTIKAVGNQWFWSYEYTDLQDGKDMIVLDSFQVDTDSQESGQLRMLTVDNYLVLPTTSFIRILVTSTDVIHSFAQPSAGIKLDAIPGRLNTDTFMLLRPGVYYGQCSELCGFLHGMMPIGVKAVPYYSYFSFQGSN